MAQRRMFAKTIIDSDAFLDMPLSSQALYFHLNMRADDDGFINNPKKIMRMIGASDDDIKVLFAKRFIIGFESGVIVIKHWRMHNYIRKDRKHDTVYEDEFRQLEQKKNGAYTLMSVKCPSNVRQVTGNCHTEVRIGKDRLDKNKYNTSDCASDDSKNDLSEEFNALWDIYPKGRKQGKKRAMEAYKRTRKKGTSFEEVKEGIESYVSYIARNRIETQFIKQASTFFSQEAWMDDWSQGVAQDDDLDGIL